MGIKKRQLSVKKSRFFFSSFHKKQPVKREIHSWKCVVSVVTIASRPTLDVHVQQSNGEIVSGERTAEKSSEYEHSVKRESNRMCTKENILPHQRLNLMQVTHLNRF